MMRRVLSCLFLACIVACGPVAQASHIHSTRAERALEQLIGAGGTIVVDVGEGGTGLTTYAIGDLIYASAATTLARLADVATGQVLTSGGVGVAPAWSAAPVLTTSLTAPLLIGGTTTTSTLILRSTSGVGAAGADIIFQTGNNGATEVMRILNNGNIGLGIAAPVAKLHVYNAASGTVPSAIFDRPAIGDYSEFIFSTANVRDWTLGTRAGDSGLYFNRGAAGTTNAMYISGANGDVGIGTAAPVEKLTVGAAATTGTANAGLGVATPFQNVEAGQLALQTTDAVAADKGGKIVFGGTYTGTTQTTFGGIGGFKENGTDGQYGGYLTFFSRTHGASQAERIRITSAGNVGIGTTTPTNLVSLGGNAARTAAMERHTTADTAGNTLTVQAGGATSGATNRAGGDLLLQPGLGTGNATPAQVRVLALAQGTASGTADQTLVNRVVVNGAVALTSGAAATIATSTVAAGQLAGGHVIYSIEATDGTDQLAASGQVAFGIVNKAATCTGATSVLGTEAQAKSDVTDTLSNVWAFAAGCGGALQVTPTLTGMTATTFRITYAVVSNSQQAITVP